MDSRPNSDALRIVSLLPSATEILDSLGLTPFVVGRSHECDYPPSIGDRPICTAARLDTHRPSAQIEQDVQSLLRSALGIYDIKLDVLRELRPTHIVTQDQCDVCAVTLADVAAAAATLTDPSPQIISLQPSTLVELWTDLERVAAQFEIDPTPCIAGLKQRIQQCQAIAPSHESGDRPTVATIEWIDPIMGGGNWMPELVELAGGRNLLGETGCHSPYYTWEQVAATDPDVVVVMPCGFDLARTRQEMAAAIAHQPQWKTLRAVQTGQFYLTDGNAYFNRPGPRLVDSLEILSEILYPAAVPPRHRPQGWEPYGPV